MQIIQSLPSDRGIIDKKDLYNTFLRLNEASTFTEDVVCHPNFEKLRRITQYTLPRLRDYEVKDMLVVVLSTQILMDDKLSKIIMNAFLQRISLISLDQIIFLDFILRKYYNLNELNKRYEIFRLTLQTMFLLKVHNEIGEFRNFESMRKIATYIGNNHEIIPSNILNSLTSSLLLADDEQFKVIDIIIILRLLSRFGELNEHVLKLLRKMFNLWCESIPTVNDVKLLSVMLAKNKDIIDKNAFNDKNFIRHCTQVLIKANDYTTSFYVQSNFNHLVSECEILLISNEMFNRVLFIPTEFEKHGLN